MLVTREETRHGGLYDARWLDGHVCGLCGGRLVCRWNAQANSEGIYCGTCGQGEAFNRLRSYTELHAAGVTVGPSIAGKLKKKIEGRRR